MSNIMGTASSYGLDRHGLHNLNMEYWSLTTPALVERIVSRREGVLAHEGARAFIPAAPPMINSSSPPPIARKRSPGAR
jgi:hypothetical protein